VTRAIKIGYSGDPKRRLVNLQSATPDELRLLGSFQGGLEHEAALHKKFAAHQLKNEWFRGGILPEVMEILARNAAPRPTAINVIVVGDSDPYFITSTDQQQMARKAALEALVLQALGELHATRPIEWVITGNERLLERFAWAWAKQNGVEVYRYLPNWKKYGRSAAFKIGPQMLRAMFDPKVLLVVTTGRASPSTTSLIRKAEKAGIEVVLREPTRVG
jgi:hypothetical protein